VHSKHITGIIKLKLFTIYDCLCRLYTVSQNVTSLSHSLYIDIYSPTCGSKEKQNTCNILIQCNTTNKTEKAKKQQSTESEQVFMALSNYVQ